MRALRKVFLGRTASSLRLDEIYPRVHIPGRLRLHAGGARAKRGGGALSPLFPLLLPLHRANHPPLVVPAFVVLVCHDGFEQDDRKQKAQSNDEGDPREQEGHHLRTRARSQRSGTGCERGGSAIGVERARSKSQPKSPNQQPHTHTHTLSLSRSLWVLFMGRGTEDWLGAMRSVAPYHEAGVLVEDGFFGHAAVTLRPRSLTFRGQKDASRSRSERRLEWGRVWRFPGPPVVRRPRSPRTLPPREGPPRVRKSFQPSCLSRQETLALPRLSHGSSL